MKPGTGLAHTALQHVRNPKRITDRVHVPLAPVLHDAGAANDLEIGNVCQLGQKIVLNAIGKRGVLSVAA